MTRNCPICGSEIPEGVSNCPACGAEYLEMVASPQEKALWKKQKQQEADEEAKRLEATKAQQEAIAAEQEAEAKRIAQMKAEQEAEKERLEAERAALAEEAKRLEAVKKAGTNTENGAGYILNDTDQNGGSTNDTNISAGSGNTVKKPGKNNKGAGVIAAVCTVAVLGIGIAGYSLFLKKPTSVNMNPYLDLTFIGVDGEGFAECHFNLSQLIKDNQKVFSLNDKSREKIKTLVHMDAGDSATDGELITALFEDMYDNGPVSILVDPDTNLKNGEKVSVSWTGGEETLEDLFGVNFICDRTTFTVKDLEEGSSSETADKDNNSATEGNTVISEEVQNNDQTAADTGNETEAADNSSEPASVTESQPEAPTTEQEPTTTSKPTTTPKPTTTTANKPKNYGKYKLVNTDYLTLRSSATMNDQNNKMLKIPGNAEVTVLQFECNGYWKVKYESKEGYVLPSYLSPCDGAKEPKKIASYRVITDYVTMRDIPSTEGESFGRITTGEVVDCFDTADNGFLLILYQGRYGYILKNYNGEVLLEKA